MLTIASCGIRHFFVTCTVCKLYPLGFLCATFSVRSKLNPASTKSSHTVQSFQCNFRLQNPSSYVSRPASLSQKSPVPNRSKLRDQMILNSFEEKQHIRNMCYFQSNSPAGELSPTETCRRHSCIKHNVNKRKAVDILLEWGMIHVTLKRRGPLSATCGRLFSATHLHVHSGVVWRHVLLLSSTSRSLSYETYL